MQTDGAPRAQRGFTTRTHDAVRAPTRSPTQKRGPKRPAPVAQTRLSYVDPPGVTKSCACQQNARDYHAPLRLPRKATTPIVELPLLVVLQSLYYSY